MEMSGGERDVNKDLNSCDDCDCIGSMSERVFQVYTNFYTHTHSICFYLRHQIWHLETEKTIHLLQSHSQSVSKQLELAGRLQINLLQQQREGLKVQRKLVENGLNLSDVLNESRGSLSRLTEQFRNSTIEQGRQLGDLFQRLAQFHNWIVGEYTFVEKIMYYSVLLIVIMIATTAKRTENCRFLLFLLAAVNIMVESLLQRFLNDEYFIEDHQIVLFNYLWLVRKLFIVIMISVYVIVTVMYVDSQQMTLNLLQRIHDQNKEIIEMLRNRESINAISDKNYYGVDRLRQSVERDDITAKFKPTNCISNSLRLNVIREQSTERILNGNIGVTTRLRSRQATPLL